MENFHDSRIKIVKNKHDFIDSLNKGLAAAKGDYIARMDTDDIMLPHRLQVQYNFMEDHPEIDICGSWMEIFGNRKNIVQVHTEHKEIVSSLLLYNTMSHPTIMFRKSTVCKNKTNIYKKGYDCAEDYKLWTDLAMKGLRFANIPEVLLKYRYSENQVTNTRQREMMRNSLKIQIEYSEQIMQQIIEQEEKFYDLLENLIVLTNESLVGQRQMLSIIYQIYANYYDKKKQ